MSLEEALAERTLWNNINTETQTSNCDLTLLLTDCPAALPEEEAAAVLSPTRRSYCPSSISKTNVTRWNAMRKHTDRCISSTWMSTGCAMTGLLTCWPPNSSAIRHHGSICAIRTAMKNVPTVLHVLLPSCQNTIPAAQRSCVTAYP